MCCFCCYCICVVVFFFRASTSRFCQLFNSFYYYGPLGPDIGVKTLIQLSVTPSWLGPPDRRAEIVMS